MSHPPVHPVSLPPVEVVFGQTSIMRGIHEQLSVIAQAPVSVLILGESGTGKELFAHLLHEYANRSKAAFVKVSCSAIPGSLMETELFGYEKGAFTGAFGTKRGRVEVADKGTLFLDEIGELDLELQPKLLQLLQDGTFNRIGGREDRKVNIRVISATNRNLHEQVELGAFRQDLFYRINALTIELPPLRRRIADLPVLVDYFLNMYNEKFGRTVKPFSPAVQRMLEHYHWPGNIRELENLIRRYTIFGTEESVTSELLAATAAKRFNAEVQLDTNGPLKQITKRALRDLEREIILKVLKSNDWNRKKTAESLQISYRSLLYKMRDAGFPQKRHQFVGPKMKAQNPELEFAFGMIPGSTRPN